MKTITRILYLLVIALSACTTTPEQKSEIPRLVTNEHGATQLCIDGKPFIMIAGELHNSSSSTEEYMAPLWPRLRDMNLNTVLAVVSWEQFEPEEGVYDYSLVESMINSAKAHDLKLVLLWFGSWKNGESSYVPTWVKRDTERFFRVTNSEGRYVETISPFCSEAMQADAKAFGQLMRYVAETDKEHTVIMVQPENEVGVFQDIDYSPQALAEFGKNVPQKLIDYLERNTDALHPHLRSIWQENGSKRTGTWADVFGDNIHAREFFMAWQYATYINEVAKAGKAHLPLPMFVNSWIVQYTGQQPGAYPNGGPVSQVMDIYKAAAPYIDIVSPDIYLPNFKEIVADYHRPDNPLLIPESRLDAGRAFYAFAEHDAICFAPFAIEDGKDNFVFAKSYEVLKEIQHLITRYQGSGNMFGILKEKDETERIIELDDYKLRIVYGKNEDPAYGLIVRTANDEFVVAGMNFRIYISSTDETRTGYFLQIREGRYRDNQWTTTRLLNGDETLHNSILNVRGRIYAVNETGNSNRDVFGSAPGEEFLYSFGGNKQIITPGIYKATVYTRK